MELEDFLINSGSRHTLSPFKREQIEKLLFINQFDDVFCMRTRFADAVCSLIQNKYSEILKQYNGAFFKYGVFVLKKPFVNCFTDEQLKKIKVDTYKELLQYYNDVLVPLIQRCSEKVAVISIDNYKFRKLENKSHLIK